MNGFDALSQSGYDMRREVLIDAALQAMGALIIATSRDRVRNNALSEVLKEMEK